jgi:hypothetical protein
MKYDDDMKYPFLKSNIVFFVSLIIFFKNHIHINDRLIHNINNNWFIIM